MTPTRYYDVIVLGRSIGCLAAAALLARRDFRVLILGQGSRPATYPHDKYRLRRRTFTLLSGASPVWQRMLQELAQSTTFKRRTRSLDPMFSVLSPDRRVEIPPDTDLFAREVEREFSPVRPIIDELYATFAEVNAAVDSSFERDAVWPPGGFWERLETRRAASQLPFTAGETAGDLLAKFPAGHPYREIATIPAAFASHLAAPGEQLPPLALARLHGAWTRGVTALERGEDELEEFLLERIRAHGGEHRLDGRAAQLVVRRGAIVGVLEDGEDEPLGTSAVVTDGSGEAIAELAGGDGITKRARQAWPELQVAAGRFVVSCIIKKDGVPGPLAQETFMLPEDGHPRSPRKPVVRVQRVGSRIASPKNDKVELLVAETLLPARGALTLTEAREAVLSTLRLHLPFLDEHLVVVDSPHDGLPLWELTDGRRREVDRIHLAGAAPGAEPMEWQWRVEPAGFMELAGEPIRGPIAGTFLVGKTVLPALGQEGELLAAWSAARVVTGKDRRRQKDRRQMWSKIETS